MATALPYFKIVADLLDFDRNALRIAVFSRIYCGLFNLLVPELFFLF